MTNLDQDVGFMKGLQAAMQKELAEIKTDIRTVTHRLDKQDRALATMDGKLDGLLVALKSTDKHPITVTTKVESDGQSSTQVSLVTKVMRWPSLPWVICIVAILAMAVFCFSVLSGRTVSTFLPTDKTAAVTP